MIVQFINQFYKFKKEIDQEKIENRYSPEYIARLLVKKAPKGKVLFHFKNKSDHIALFSNRQLNVRGEEDMFRAWGSSEFNSLKPQAIFEELEKEIVKIKVISASGRNNYSFSSYGEFL
ncbi:MAG: hypothetical protein C4291_01260 [Candidatus Dadabacteria bacterium]